MARALLHRLAALAAFMSLVTLLITTIIALQLPLLVLYPLTVTRPLGERARKGARWLYRGGMRFTEQLWASFILVFMSLFASSAHGHPPTLRIHAEPTVLDTLVSDRAPVISGNHQSLLDWIYAWIIAAQRGRGGDLKIFMKDAIGRIPLLGFALRNVELVLLKRNWLADKRNFERYMDLIREDDWGYWTLIYAEGTTLDASTLEKSKNYAEKMGLTHPNTKTLLPRALGLFSVLRKLSANPAATKHLYLVAQAYAPLPEGSYAWDVYTPAKVFFGGEGPERVEWRVWRFDVKDIPGIRDAVMDEEEDGISMPRPEHPERQGLRNRAGRPRAGAWQDSIGTEHPTPSLEITSHDAEPPVDPVEPEPVTAEQENGDRGRNLSSPPDRSRSLSPSSAHNLPTEEARRLDQFAAWLNDRWLQIDNAMINYSASGSFGSDVLVNDLKITGSQNPKLQRDEIGCTPSLTDLISLLLAVLAVYYPLITGLAWLGFTVFWQVVGFFVVVFGVTAAGWAVGILG